MQQVFTLWPGDEQLPPSERLDDDGMPLWALSSGEPPLPPRWAIRNWLLPALPLAVVPVLTVVGLAGTLDRAGTLALGFAAIALTAFGLWRFRQAVGDLQQQAAASRRWSDIVFERTGIALWREDWTAVRDEVLRLLRSGVRDMQAYFARYPDELRALRKLVIIKDVNGLALQRTGARDKDALIGPLDRVLPDTDQTFVQWLVAFARGDKLYRSETHLTAADGSSVHTLFAAGLPIDMRGFEDILISDLDITEYKMTQIRLAEAEREVARAARISTIGALSASIAHEVCTPLSVASASVAAALDSLDQQDPDVAEAITRLKVSYEAALRAEAVVKRTRAFVTNSPVALEPQNLTALIRDALSLIDREIRANGASVHLDATEDFPTVMADAVNIQQVVVNLLLNAMESICDSSVTRDVTVRITNQEACIRVEVADNGSGIDPTTIKSIFDPFFSTKEGRMGLGLAICRSCIRAHGGRLWATSSVGEGSTFYFELPVSAGLDNG